MGLSMKGRREYLEEVKLRYLNGDRGLKCQILNEASAVTKMHRKSIIRYFHSKINQVVKKRVLGKRGRKCIYDYPEFKEKLKDIWLETEKMCSRNLAEAMSEWLPSYEKMYGKIELKVRHDLLQISHASIDRIINPYRRQFGRGKCGTKPGTLIKNTIPIKGENWDPKLPGFMEVDTVAHCGGSLLGEFVWTLTLTDVHTQWTEIRPVWHKEAKETLAIIKRIAETLPFKILALNADNGAEFMNHHFLNYFMHRDNQIYFSRSRPYKKNDNAHVEQKNWTHARSLLGYGRLDNRSIMTALTEILANWSLLKNHFYPCKKLISKAKVGSKFAMRYEIPKTPYQRLMESNKINQANKNKLKQIHDSLDPCLLRRQIRANLNKLLQNSSVTSNYEASYPKRTSLR